MSTDVAHSTFSKDETMITVCTRASRIDVSQPWRSELISLKCHALPRRRSPSPLPVPISSDERCDCAAVSAVISPYHVPLSIISLKKLAWLVRKGEIPSPEETGDGKPQCLFVDRPGGPRRPGQDGGPPGLFPLMKSSTTQPGLFIARSFS